MNELSKSSWTVQELLVSSEQPFGASVEAQWVVIDSACCVAWVTYWMTVLRCSNLWNDGGWCGTQAPSSSLSQTVSTSWWCHRRNKCGTDLWRCLCSPREKSTCSYRAEYDRGDLHTPCTPPGVTRTLLTSIQNTCNLGKCVKPLWGKKSLSISPQDIIILLPVTREVVYEHGKLCTKTVPVQWWHVELCTNTGHFAHRMSYI